MKRMHADISLFRLLLVVALLAAQFGCASVQKPPYFYNPSGKVVEVIERPNVYTCAPYQFDTKLDEVRKKTRLFAPTSAIAESLLVEVEALSGVTKETYRKVDNCQRKTALFGGLIAWTVSLAYILSWDMPIMDEVYLVKASPFIALIGGGVGALAGSSVGGVFAVKKLREPLPEEKVRPLDSLVVRYNTYIAEKAKETHP